MKEKNSHFPSGEWKKNISEAKRRAKWKKKNERKEKNLDISLSKSFLCDFQFAVMLRKAKIYGYYCSKNAHMEEHILQFLCWVMHIRGPEPVYSFVCCCCCCCVCMNCVYMHICIKNDAGCSCNLKDRMTGVCLLSRNSVVCPHEHATSVYPE